VIEIAIGDRTFQATPLFFPEYKRAAKIFADAQRYGLAGDLQSVVICYEALLEILCIAVRRAGSQVDLEEIGKAATPWEIVKAASDLMQQSSIGNASAVGKPN
jgi:hypothetical protein